MESEWRTRKTRIDAALRQSRWEIVPHAPELGLSSLTHHAVEELPTDHGPADYALIVDGQLLGVVEAKKLSLGPQNVLVQAERYSRGATQSGFDFHGFRVPFLCSTNGEVIWFHDVRHELECSRRISAFPTPAALTERMTRNFEADCESLLDSPNEHPRLRPYQCEANAATEAAIAARKRQMLVAMATGTGKTFTTVNQVYRLMKSGVATAKADKLTQAILAKAFRGELVPTEADLARTEARDYETAEQLLIWVQSNSAIISNNAKPGSRRRVKKSGRSKNGQ